MRRNRVVSGLLIMGVLAVGIPGALAKPIPNRVSVAPSYTFIADEDLRGVGVALSILGPAACVGRIPGFSYLGVPSYYLMADWAGLDDTSSVGVETGGRFSHEINRIRLRQRALVLAYGVGVFGYHISRYPLPRPVRRPGVPIVGTPYEETRREESCRHLPVRDGGDPAHGSDDALRQLEHAPGLQ